MGGGCDTALRGILVNNNAYFLDFCAQKFPLIFFNKLKCLLFVEPVCRKVRHSCYNFLLGVCACVDVCVHPSV